jgi:beta-galactosidase
MAVWAPRVLLLPFVAAASSAAPPRRVSLDLGWRFYLGEPQSARSANCSAVASPGFDDRGWRAVTIPHDFVVEGNFSRGAGPAKRGDLAHGYLPSGVGWYRRSFEFPQQPQQAGWLTFDGIFRAADVYLNGRLVAHHRSGYTGFDVQLGGGIAAAGTNVLAVRCDASRGEGWWYEGGGIYRHTWLTTVPPVHIVPHGVFATAVVVGDVASSDGGPAGLLTSTGGAAVTVETTVANSLAASAHVVVSHSLTGPDGGLLHPLVAASTTVQVPARGNATVSQQLSIADARLWSLEAPSLYTLATTVQPRTIDSRDLDAGALAIGRRVI